MLFLCSITLLLCCLGSDAGKSDDGFNYKISGSDGSTYILTVTDRIDPKLKKIVLALDGAAAYTVRFAPSQSSKVVSSHGLYFNMRTLAGVFEVLWCDVRESPVTG